MIHVGVAGAAVAVRDWTRIAAKRGSRASVPAKRVECVDACRGVAVVGMLAANLVNVYLRHVPSVLAHNQGPSLRLFDLPAPLFQFLIGVSLTLFLRNRIATGRTPAAARFDAARRFLLLILLGVVLDGIGGLSPAPRWGVLQTLGLGGLLATLLDAFSPTVCAVVALGLLGLFSGPANGIVLEHPLAALAFVPLTLAGVLVGRTLGPDGDARTLLPSARAIGTAALVAAAALFAAGVPFDKTLGTSSFVVLATAVSAGLLYCTAALEVRGQTPGWIVAIGRNALTAWVTLYVVVYYPAWLVFPSWHRLGLGPGLVAVLATTALLSEGAVALGRRGVRIPL